MVALPLIIVTSLAALRLTDQGNTEILRAKSQKAEEDSPFGLLKDKKMMDKIKKYQKDPHAFEKLSGAQKDMAEKYMKRFGGSLPQ